MQVVRFKKRGRAGAGTTGGRLKRARASRSFRGRVSRVRNGVEWKFHDLDVDDANVAAGGTIAEDSCLTIPEGNGESDRIGRKLTVRRIQWSYNLTIPALIGSASQSPDTVRVILYLDKQTNGAAATATGILESADFQSFVNLANSGRFRLLCDKLHTVKGSPNGAGDGAANDFSANEQNYTFVRNVAIPIEYDNSATTGVITSMRSNNIGVLLVGKNGIASFESKMRFRYSDN